MGFPLAAEAFLVGQSETSRPRLSASERARRRAEVRSVIWAAIERWMAKSRKLGAAMAATIPMIAMTTSISCSVKPAEACEDFMLSRP
ncbi:Uncharacterised protein [Lautropia mirabilis]|nr:Uncharacterised protein [Lautropia mirabilis]